MNKVSFVYDHKKAIIGEKDNTHFCTVRLSPNEYLKSILSYFGEDASYVFTNKGVTHSNEDIIKLEETDSIIITYTFKENNNVYSRKKLITDGDTIELDFIGD